MQFTYTRKKIIDTCATKAKDPMFREIPEPVWKSALEQALLEIYHWHNKKWKFAMQEGTVNTSAGTDVVAIGSLNPSGDVEVPDVFNMFINSTQMLEKVSPEQFYQICAKEDTDARGTPKMYCVVKISGTYKIILFPIPDASYQIYYLYKGKLILPATDTSYTQIPDEFIYVVIYGMLAEVVGGDYWKLFDSKFMDMITWNDNQEEHTFYFDPNVYYGGE
jgi:hypothetical protein